MNKNYAIRLSIFFMIYTQSLLAMEENHDPREDILIICDGFELSLTARLGCVLCKCINTSFKTDKYHRYQQRIDQVNAIRQIVNNSPTWSHDINQLLDSYFEDAVSPISKSFKSSCKAILKNIKEIDIECLICLENYKTIFSESCGHLIYCQKCFDATTDKNEKLNTCPKCRSECTNYNFINENYLYSHCQICYEEIADILLDCGHVALCKDCDLKNTEQHLCPICHQSSTNTYKIFR